MAKKEEDHFSNYEQDALTKPRDRAWENWAKFEKVGDKFQGYIADVFYRPAEGQFPEQRGITLKQLDGTYVNVGIKRKPFILNKTDELHIGDPLTIELIELKPSATKGFSATKIYGYFGKILEENKSKQNVRSLEAEDIAKGGTTSAVPVEEGEKEDEGVPFD